MKAGSLALALALPISLAAAGAASALSAGPDPALPGTLTSVDGSWAGFLIGEHVAYDPASGPWVLELRNAGSGIGSGEPAQLSLALTNVGGAAWTGWSQAVLSTTTVTSSGETIVGFLLVADSLVLTRDGTPLVEGLDYTLAPIVHTATTGGTGGGSSNYGHWEAVSIVFAASGQIAPGQTLGIEQQIFEVYLDGDPWRPDDVAAIQQAPAVPEPQAWGMLAVGLALVLLGRRSP